MKIKMLITLLFMICMGVNQPSFGMELTPAKKRIWFKCGEEQISIKNNTNNLAILKRSAALKNMFEDLGCVDNTFENLDNPIPLQGINNKKEFDTIFGLMERVHKNKKKHIETKLRKSNVQELCPLIQTCDFHSISSKTINLTTVICKVIVDKYNSKTDQLCIKQLPFDLHNLVAQHRAKNVITHIDCHGKCLAGFDSYEKLFSVAFNADDKGITIGSESEAIKIWDIETQQCIQVLNGCDSEVGLIVFSPDGNTIATIFWNEVIKLWDIKTGQCTKTFTENIGSVYSAAFSSDGNSLATGSWYVVKILDINTGQCIKTFDRDIDLIFSLVFSPDGKSLVMGCNQIVQIWDIKTEKCVKSLVGHTNPIVSLAFSSDGKNLITGSKDSTAKMWDLETGQCTETFVGRYIITSVTFSPDGKRIVTGSMDGAQIWDIETGQYIKTLIEHLGAVYSLAFSKNGKKLVTGSGDAARIWNMDDAASKQALLKNLTIEQADFLVEKVYPVIERNKIFKLATDSEEYEVFMSINEEGQKYLNSYLSIINRSKK